MLGLGIDIGDKLQSKLPKRNIEINFEGLTFITEIQVVFAILHKE